MLETVFRVLTQDEELADRIDQVLSGFERTTKPARAARIVQVTGSPGQPHRLHRGCFRVRSDRSGEELLPTLLGVINQATIEACPHFAVHSAVVANGGRAVALPAGSGGGKSTLSAASVLGGLSYMSDEALVLDDAGRVIPYPKPIALSPWSCFALGIPSDGIETLVLPADLGGTARLQPAELTDVVISRYGEEPTALEEIPRSEATTALLSKSFNHYKDPERAFRLATEAARRVKVWSLQYNDPIEAAELLAVCLS